MSGVWLTDLVDVLSKAGVPAIGMKYTRGPYSGKSWKQVGFNGQGYRELRGVMLHHDASPPGDSPSALDWCMYMDIAPAAAIWVDRSGKFWCYAAGMSNHAGLGSHPLAPDNTGNFYFLGIETDHTEGEEWPLLQLENLRKGVAAILAAYELDPFKALTFHRTYAPTRKTDPAGLDLATEQKAVAKLMGRATPSPAEFERRIDVVKGKIRALKDRLVVIRRKRDQADR